MDLYDWLLFLHVFSAFVGVGALVVLWGLVAGTREPEPAIDAPTATALGKWAGIGVGVGLMGALLFGIWLAIEVDGYELWDGWILASLVLWAVGGWSGGRAGKEAERGPEGRAGWIRFQAINSAAVLLILVLMIWKPGA
jgi:uncharacterized membrane protein